MAAVAPASTGLIVDLLGFLTGTVLYVMLVAMVWRERAVRGHAVPCRAAAGCRCSRACAASSGTSARSRPFGIAGGGREPPAPLVVAVAFSALGFLPAVVVHSLLEGRETAAGRRVIRPAIADRVRPQRGRGAPARRVRRSQAQPVPSRPALWLLTGGFTALTAVLLLVTRQQPIGRRGIWVAALSVFAVSALHFGRHVGNEAWWVELIGHHASLLLALAILHQDYRFALADLFLKNAIALLLLMGISLASFSGAMVPLLGLAETPNGVWDPRAIALFVALWMATALTFPLLRRWSRAARRSRRPAPARLRRRAGATSRAHSMRPRPKHAVIGGRRGRPCRRRSASPTLASIERSAAGRQPARPSSPGPQLRALIADPARASLLLRLRTVEPPHPALALRTAALPDGGCSPTTCACSRRWPALRRGGSTRCAWRRSASSATCASRTCSGSRPKPSSARSGPSSIRTFSSTR